MPMNPRPIPFTSNDQIAREWNAVCQLRCDQIEQGKDLSFTNVLLPTILTLAEGLDHSNVLDVGCGAGFVTRAIASLSTNVVGIDLSKASIELANERMGDLTNIEYIHSSVEHYAEVHRGALYTLVISNMMLMTAPNLNETVKAISSLLMPSSQLAFTVCHPCFWPKYWQYDAKPWFHYEREITIEAPFRITLDPTATLMTTHVHRSLERYLTALEMNRLVVQKLFEPMPSLEIQEKYGKRWEFPRFLGVRCRKD